MRELKIKENIDLLIDEITLYSMQQADVFIVTYSRWHYFYFLPWRFTCISESFKVDYCDTR